jgi:ribosomal protein S18 acetylase RimI-like enzyme
VAQQTNHRIDRASRDDLRDIRAAYEHARAMQQDRAVTAWPEFSDAAILDEIRAGRLYRVLIDDDVVGVFSIALEDPAIWGAHERGRHLYLHRIARAASYPGRGLVDVVLAWAERECIRLGRDGLRMDTWASNAALIDFYQRRGFRLVDERRIEAEPRLPSHYHHNTFALLERSCGG